MNEMMGNHAQRIIDASIASVLPDEAVRRAMLQISACPDSTTCADAVFSLGSDGTDGPTDAAGGYVDGDTADTLYPRRELVCAVKDTLYPAVSTLLHRLNNQFYTKNEKMLCRKKQSILIFCCHNAVNSKTRTLNPLKSGVFRCVGSFPLNIVCTETYQKVLVFDDNRNSLHTNYLYYPYYQRFLLSKSAVTIFLTAKSDNRQNPP